MNVPRSILCASTEIGVRIGGSVLSASQIRSVNLLSHLGRWKRAAAVVLLPVWCCASSLLAEDYHFGTQTFTVPDGYVVEQVAAAPVVDRPINMAFDEAGALYVTDSSGANERPVQQLGNPTHRVLRLVDADRDGRFESHTVFADKLPFPEGTMWLDGSLYVAAPPVIWKFTDTNGDGVADKKEVWFDGGTVTGCANDLHGPYAGPDGYVYWCKGAFAEQRHQLDNAGDFVTRASHVFRARPDGSGREVVLTGGMDNPVGLAFSATGERFLSGTFFVKPGDGLRDGILHGVYGGVWGKEHGVLDGHVRTGELMPVMSHLGPAAAAGLEMLRGDAAGMKGALLCAQFNLRKVSAHRLSAAGATFRSADSDFLVSGDPDFHPTDVVEDADGSVLVADTGGWYKICCPTSKELKPEVLGAIYRISKKGAQRQADPRGLLLEWGALSVPQLVARLSDPRQEVASRALRMLARRDAVSELSQVLSGEASAGVRSNALWALIRIGSEAAKRAIRPALGDSDEAVKACAIYGAGLLRDGGAVEALRGLLGSGTPQHARGAAEALGRLHDKGAIPALVRHAPVERFGFHSSAYALYEIGEGEALSKLSGGSVPGAAGPNVVRTALAMLAAPKALSVPALPLVQASVNVDPALRQVQLARLHELLAFVKKGDAQRGAEIFRGTKANCALCHAVAGAGGVLGPDLTKAGAIRTATDLMEAILYPSASYVRSYEPVMVRLKSGEEHYGILRDEASEVVRLATGPATEVRLKRSEISGLTEGMMSLMPPGFDGVLAPGELADLVAYLQVLR